jgi:hypothetical protein
MGGKVMTYNNNSSHHVKVFVQKDDWPIISLGTMFEKAKIDLEQVL